MYASASFQTKGLPVAEGQTLLDPLPSRGWRVLDDRLPYPLATLSRSALSNNLRWQQDWARRKGVELAPHGKTTLSPELFDLQLKAGAWGMTVAHVAQLPVALAAGAQRCIIANQVLAAVDLDGLLHLRQSHPQARIWFLVDSQAQLELIEAWHRRQVDAPALDVLLELGLPGYRTGCRDAAQALTLARAIAASPAVRLCGLECYEGGLARADAAPDGQAMSALVRRVRESMLAIDQEALWQDPTVLVTAGGSAIFDLVLPMLTGYRLQRPVQGVLRSGCYITHDHGNYAGFLQRLEVREGLASSLLPALEVWALVQSVPEPGLALLNAGRRDVSFDQRMPLPVRWAMREARTAGPAPAHWQVHSLSDQHAHMRFDPAGPAPQVGDRVALGISHPCTTFDKWRWMALVEDDGRISGTIHTFF